MTPIRLRSLRSKLLLAFGVLALAPLVVLSVLSTREATQKLEALGGEHLSARAVTVANAFDAYLDERQADLALFVRHPSAVAGTTQELTALADSYIEVASSYDLIVVADADGKILATNTHTGDHKQVSGLVGKSVQGQAWFDATRAAPAGTRYVSPGAEISPLVAQATHADGKGVTFAMGIFDEHGQLVRVWANQISWERSFSAIVRRELELMKRTGIRSAQIAVMDRGGRLMDEAPVAGELSTLNLLRTSTAAQASVNGPAGYVHEVDPIDHRDDMVGYAPVPHPNGWIVLAHETDAEVASSADGIRHFAWIVGLCAGAFVVLGSMWFARGLTRRLAGVVQTLERVAEGDLTARAPTHGDDEIATMTRALHGALDRIGGAFGSIGQGVVAVSQASEALTSVGATLSASAQHTSRQAGIVATASEQAGKNVQTVAAGTEEMSVTIKEVAKNAAEAARVATAAVVRAERTNALVGKLGESSVEIGNVLKVITSIAEQTNLLALNATIEAARAGEAGKGFAVVANEVKELAKETARATDDITRKIAAIQTDTASAVAAIGEITLVIGQINDIQSTIASAVEQQAATTNEIGRNLHELAEASNEIAQNVTSVAASAGSTSECSQQTRTAATGLADLSRSLDDQMRQFRFKRGEGPAPRRQTTGTLVRVPAISFEGTTSPGLRH